MCEREFETHTLTHAHTYICACTHSQLHEQSSDSEEEEVVEEEGEISEGEETAEDESDDSELFTSFTHDVITNIAGM